jgi:4-amino-4-deoxy-L-arabinose transferase-like glycosyltransferase
MTQIIASDGTSVKQPVSCATARGCRLVAWLRSAPSSIWLIVALLLATAARLPALGQQSLWIDEGNTYIRMILPLDAVLENLLAVRDQTPLYYLLLRPWVRLFGTSEFALRLPSAWCAVVNVALMARLGRLSGQRGVGVWAALAMAVNPFLVRYACEARMYTMAILFSTGAMWCFLLAVRRDGWWRWATLAVVSGIAYLTHYVTFVVGLVQFLVLLITLRTTYRFLRKWVLAQAVAAAPAVSWMALSMRSHGYGGIAGAWIPVPSLLTPLRTLWNFSLGYDGRFTLWTALGLLPFAVGLAGGAWLASGRLRTVRQLWQSGVLVWLTLPPLMALVLSFGLRPCYLDRYLAVCAPAYLLWVVAGLSAVPRPGWRAVLGGLLLVAMAASTFGILQGQRLPAPDWRRALAHVLGEAESGDRLFVDAKGFYVTFYYAGHALPIERLDMRSAGAALDEALCQGGRIWFLYRDPAESCHVFDRVRRFDPYTLGQLEIGSWLVDHAEYVRHEWFLKGVYLALIDPDGCSGGTLPEDGGRP